MTDYTMIDTNDLMTRWNDYGCTTSMCIYGDGPAQQIQSIMQTKRDVIVMTDLDTYVIPRGDKSIKMWKILG